MLYYHNDVRRCKIAEKSCTERQRRGEFLYLYGEGKGEMSGVEKAVFGVVVAVAVTL